MKTVLLLLILTIANTLQASDAQWIAERCTQNSLDPNQAHGRNAWTKKCSSNFSSETPNILSLVDFYDSGALSAGRPSYALVSNPEGTRWDAPIDTNSGCETFSKLRAFCLSSCYTPDQKILYEDGYTAILDAVNTKKNNIVGLSRESTLDSLEFKILPVDGYTKSWRNDIEPIRILKTHSGGELKVTLNHPLIVSSGVMKKANDLIVGDSLVKTNGEFDEIVEIKDISYFGKVYNVVPTSLDPLENIIVAQGYLTGSGNYQFHEMFQDLMYRQLLRSTIDLDKFNEN